MRWLLTLRLWGKCLRMKEDGSLARPQQVNTVHFLARQVVTWHYDEENHTEDDCGLACLGRSSHCGSGNQKLAAVGLVSSSDVCLLHSEELARWLELWFLNELAACSQGFPRGPAPSVLALGVCVCGWGGGGLFSCRWELAAEPQCYCAVCCWTNLRREEFFWGGRAAPGDGHSGQRKETAYQKQTASGVVFFWMSLLKKSSARDLREAKCWWLEVNLYVYGCPQVCQGSSCHLDLPALSGCLCRP